MKKLLIYTWLPCLLAMFMSAAFVSCGDDDDEENGSGQTATATSNSLIGKWGNPVFISSSDPEDDDDIDYSASYQYNEDGTCVYSDSEDTYEVTYTFNSETGELIVTSGEGGFIAKYLVYFENENKIIVQETYYKDPDGYEERGLDLTYSLTRI